MKKSLKLHTKKTSACQAVINYVIEYCSITSVHGFNHIVNSRHLLEKLIWIFLVVVSVYYGWSLSFVTLNRYYTNPVVISIERDRFSWTTYLPAVTICPEQNINETSLDGIVEMKKSSNRTKLREFLISLFYANYTNFDKVEDNDEIDPEEYMSIILKLQNVIKTSIIVSGQSLDSKQWLKESITEMGVCYCFNCQLAVYSSPKYWSDNKWEVLSQFKAIEIHPLDGEVFASIVNISTGFNVYIHGPYEVADIRSRPIYVANTYFVQVYLTALSIISSENTKNLRISQRKCRYYHESNLSHSPVYTYVLCRMECRIALAQNLCGCVPHFYRKFPYEKTCGVKGLGCLSQHKEQLVYMENLDNDCRCAANCDEVNYVVEEIDFREWFLGSNLQFGIKTFPEMRLKREVIFGFSDLLVYIGGVMGLFLGFSVLTLIEFLYYFTLRLFWFVVRN